MSPICFSAHVNICMHPNKAATDRNLNDQSFQFSSVPSKGVGLANPLRSTKARDSKTFVLLPAAGIPTRSVAVGAVGPSVCTCVQSPLSGKDPVCSAMFFKSVPVRGSPRYTTLRQYSQTLPLHGSLSCRHSQATSCTNFVGLPLVDTLKLQVG